MKRILKKSRTFYNILSDCRNSDETNYLLNAFRLKRTFFQPQWGHGLNEVELWFLNKCVFKRFIQMYWHANCKYVVLELGGFEFKVWVILIYDYFDPVVVQVVTSFTVNYLFVNLRECFRCSPKHATKESKSFVLYDLPQVKYLYSKIKYRAVGRSENQGVPVVIRWA